MTLASAAKGTRFQMLRGSPPAYSTIAEIKNISGLDESRETIDATNHDSPGDYREFLTGLKDAGVVTITGNYIWGDQSQSDLYDLYQSGEVGSFKILRKTVDQGKSFDAIVQRFTGPTAPIDGINEFTAEIKVTGQPSDVTP